ncbi:MAG: transcription antitermination factor NusB [Gammaproteobacteria bacterium]|nr:transcription antitermination factor NusB [Gammaproteobacteria bacterium]
MTQGSGNRGRIFARRNAVQALYQWLLTGDDPAGIRQEFIAERDMKGTDFDYFERLVGEVPRQYQVLLAQLEPLLDRPWQQVTPVERAVLLLGCYELLFCIEIPRRVVINEAVELVKTFGTEEGYRYINALLDKVSRKARAIEYAADGKSG